MAIRKKKTRRSMRQDDSEKVALFPRKKNEDKTANCCVRSRQGVKRHIFLIFIILAMAAGFGLGFGLRELETPLNSRQMSYLRFPADIFLQMLSMLLIPLIVSSIITATTSLSPNASGRMGVISLVYYICTTILAVSTGLFLVLVMKPGESPDNGIASLNQNTSTVSPDKTIDTVLDLVRNLFPPNIVEASFKKLQTKEYYEAVNTNNISFERPHIELKVSTTQVDGTNVLGIISFSLVLGLIISKLGNEGRPLAVFFEALNLAVMKLITLVIWYAPIGVMFLIASKIAEIEEPLAMLHQLSWFVITVVLGFVIHGIITLPMIFVIVTRRNPFTYLCNMLEALITVFSTSSSAATLPVTIRCLVENNNLDKRVVHFVTPVGTTVNMDGSAIYQAIAAIFLAQYSGMTLSVGQIATVGPLFRGNSTTTTTKMASQWISAGILLTVERMTSVAASIGAAPIPSGSLVAMVMVLTSAGIPADIALIAAVDWLLDRFRGMINVEGDAFAAGVVASMVRDELHKERVIVEHSRFGQEETALTMKDNYYELP